MFTGVEISNETRKYAQGWKSQIEKKKNNLEGIKQGKFLISVSNSTRAWSRLLWMAGWGQNTQLSSTMQIYSL